MRQSGKFLFLLIISTILIYTCSVSGACADEVVFKQSLDKQATIVVTRHEIPDNAPEAPLPPGFVYEKTAHVYRYDFFLMPPKGKKKLLWQHTFYVYPPGKLFATDVSILAAAFQEDTLIVVYKGFNKTNGGTTYANIVTNASRDDKKELPFPQTKLTYDSDAASVYITAAKIEGSLAQNNLSVRLANVHTFLHYVWKEGKWQQVLVPPPAPVPSQTGTADAPPPHP